MVKEEGTIAQQTEQHSTKVQAVGATPSSSAYELSDKEKFAVEIVIKNHECEVTKALKNTHCLIRKIDKIIEDAFTYKYTQTGIGTVTEITCDFCDKTYNITDYSTW